MEFCIPVTHPRPVVVQATCVRTKPLMCAAETLSTYNRLTISVAMETTSRFPQAVFVARNLRGELWWDWVMPVVETHRITRMTHRRSVYVERCMILCRRGNAVEERLWPLHKSAAEMRPTEPSTT